MSDRSRPLAPDLLGLVSVGAIASLITILCYVAASFPGTRSLLTLVIIGLGAGGLILFRQLRKGHGDLMTREARAQYMATHDDVTQLPNKTLFLRRLAEPLAEARDADGEGPVVAVLCIGLDRFGEVTELLGHAASDAILAEAAQRLSEICGLDGALARLGDDAFAVAWSVASRDGARQLAEDLIERLSAPYAAASGQTLATASVGISFLTPKIKHPVEALRHAQMALTNARKRGGGQPAFYQPAMDQALRRRMELEAELRRAVSTEALGLLYQPQVDAKGQIVGVEALMRWTTPDGEISPATFVPLAESCGLADAIGRFALRRAFQDSMNWSGLKVAVNVSAAQVRSGTLIPTLKGLLADTGLSARAFEMEITESLLLADETEIHETLHAIRRLGFSIALDDFGTGYSSLSYLRRFPVDKIKIDRAFVMQLGKQPESSAIVKAIVELAEALELKVIAEGVETRDQVERLGQIGPMHYQGYLFSRPVSAATIDELVAGRARLAA